MLFRSIVLAAACCSALGARAQSSCSSDGQPRPTALVERFINADCEACWQAPGAPLPANAVALDWIVPGARGDDAPLAAAARRDGLERLAALGRAVPLQADDLGRTVAPRQRPLRVAHGLPVNDYVGASIAYRPAASAAGPLSAWLVLVEHIPAGTEGSPVARNLVRNALQHSWDLRKPLSKKEHLRLFESRAMALPDGTRADRMRAVGWVQDAQGRVLAAAESRCTP